ncbi:MAG: helix-turn-helix domain-containing protein [Actinomycetota bacterium]
MATQAERTATTRARILDAARELFADRGFDATTVGDLLLSAEVSKGALYHHFASKEAVAETLFAETSRAAIDAASRATDGETDPLDGLVAACLRWIDQVADPAVATVMFEIGPSALGWERCRRIEDAHSLRVLRLGIGAAVAAGRFAPDRVDLAARTINAVLAELAWLVVHPEESAVDDHDIADVVRATVHALAGAGT